MDAVEVNAVEVDAVDVETVEVDAVEVDAVEVDAVEVDVETVDVDVETVDAVVELQAKQPLSLINSLLGKNKKGLVTLVWWKPKKLAHKKSWQWPLNILERQQTPVEWYYLAVDVETGTNVVLAVVELVDTDAVKVVGLQTKHWLRFSKHQ